MLLLHRTLYDNIYEISLMKLRKLQNKCLTDFTVDRIYMNLTSIINQTYIIELAGSLKEKI